MGRMSLETRAKVVRLKNRGMAVLQIATHLDKEGVYVLKVSCTFYSKSTRQRTRYRIGNEGRDHSCLTTTSTGSLTTPLPSTST